MLRSSASTFRIMTRSGSGWQSRTSGIQQSMPIRVKSGGLYDTENRPWCYTRGKLIQAHDEPRLNPKTPGFSIVGFKPANDCAYRQKQAPLQKEETLKLFRLINWNLLIKNFLYRIIIVFCDQGNLFSIRSVTIYDLMIILFHLFSCTIRIIKPCFDIRGM